MQSSKSPITGLVVSVVLSLLFLSYFYGDILLSPNSFLFSSKGDGIKNYYTYIYQIKNNESYTNFEGFNYPFGENHLYTDSQPLLSTPLQFLDKRFPLIGKYSIGLMNFLMLISYVFGTGFLYLILNRLKLPTWLSCITALSIMMLSPQIFRLGGHYGLSYTFVIPATSYLLLIYFSSSRQKVVCGSLFFIGISCFFLHAYLGLLACSIILGYSVVHFTFSPDRILKLRVYLFLLFAGLTPIIIFRLYAFLTDSHKFRTTNPFGFFEYYADFYTILTPTYGGFKTIFINNLPVFSHSWEGFSYLGLSSIITGTIVASIWSFKLIKNRNLRFLQLFNYEILILIFTSFCLLFFSFGYPFRWWMTSLEYLPMLKQFRSIGRFAWPFYYLFNVFTIYFLYNLISSISLNKFYRSLLLFIFPALMIYESYDQHKAYSDKLSESENLFHYNNLESDLKTLINQIDQSQYQAIIPIPFYHVGSENFSIKGSDQSYKHSMLASYHLNLPLTSSLLSRTSIKESKLNIQFLGSTLYKKKIKSYISSEKPFLILKVSDELKSNEKALLKRYKKLISNKKFELYEIQPSQLFINQSVSKLKSFEKIKPSLSLNHEFLSADSTAFFFYKDLDSNFNTPYIGGQGSVEWIKKGWNKLASFSSDSLQWTQNYLSSFWIYNCGNNFGQDRVNYLNFSIREVYNNTIIKEQIIEASSTYDIKDCWSRVESKPFRKNKEGSIFEFWLGGFEYQENKIIVDDFFIHPIGTDIYQERDSVLFYNNHLINRKDEGN